MSYVYVAGCYHPDSREFGIVCVASTADAAAAACYDATCFVTRFVLDRDYGREWLASEPVWTPALGPRPEGF